MSCADNCLDFSAYETHTICMCRNTNRSIGIHMAGERSTSMTY